MASTRAQVITRRTYNRPLNQEGTIFETWEQTIGRVISHQKWLWERAKGETRLTEDEWNELAELQELLIERKAAVAGRTYGWEILKYLVDEKVLCLTVLLQ